MNGHTESKPKALSDMDLFAALTQVKIYTPMLAQALADHIGVRAQQMTRCREALQAISGMDPEENEWDAVEKYDACQKLAREALADELVSGEPK